MDKILIGISGGIDSAAATLRLREQGYHVTALWIDMLGNTQQRQRVEQLCDRLRVPLIVSDARDLFDRQVIGHTLAELQAGRTPSPCAVCNAQVKWAVLVDAADSEGIVKIATGHYVQIVQRNDRHYIARGIDPTKDQSYYLYALGENVLSRIVTPLGAMLKTQTRHFLAAEGFADLASGGESQGLCFVERGYSDFIRQNLAPTAGDVVDNLGCVIGRHDGYQIYTIGQKRGFSPAGVGEVRHLDARSNRIEVGEPSLVRTIICDRSIFRPFDHDCPINVAVRGIGRNPKGDATIECVDGHMKITLLDDTAWAVAPGQPVVLYCQDIVIGGGIVQSAY